ncbi:PAS domain S-box protein [Roseomonas sp. GC11]|uniref:PAS domain S-box protein n=1 Tax=Roseomonas sp. GC11 TaxID=2950546 RepID=UPI00210E35EF|nr:PAS domain S-box protein [Roseomonas sp. GC11]MCQ4162880.1 PAS domain S-box protein [Roseomonas sp. GC11]
MGWRTGRDVPAGAGGFAGRRPSTAPSSAAFAFTTAALAQAGGPAGSKAGGSPTGGGAGSGGWSAARGGAGRPPAAVRTVRLLLAGSLLLPAALLGLLSWQAWEQSWDEATLEVARSAEAGAEYARRVLDGHRLRAQRANDMMRGLSDATIRAEEALVSAQLATLVEQAGGASVISLYVFDAAGHPLVSGTVPAVPHGQSFADRPFNQILRGPGAPEAAVTGPYRGRLDGADFFAVSLRRQETGNDRPPGSYQGIINVSVRIGEAAERLQRLLKNPADTLALLGPGGAVLARAGKGGAGREAEGKEAAGREGEDPAAFDLPAGATPGQPWLERGPQGVRVLQPVEGWEVTAYAARPRAEVLARWEARVGQLLLLGVPAALALFGLALLVRHGQRALVAANAGLERGVAERTAALAASEERLRLAQEAAGIGVWEHEMLPEGRAIWSAQQFRLLGLDPSAPVPSLRALLRRVLPQDRRGLLAALRAAAPQVTLRLRRADGAVRWLTLIGRRMPAMEGRPARLLGVAADITERHANAAALAEAEERYRALFEGAPFAVFLFDPHSHAILDVNARACLDYGYSPEEFRRLTLGDIDVLGEAEAIKQRGRRHAVAGGMQEYEARHRLRDGTQRDVLVRVQGVRLRGRNLSYAAHMDITARRRAEEERMLLAREVDHRAKNVLALVQAALRLTPKEDPAAYTAAVEGRVMALARAHTLLAQAYWTGAELRALLEGELATFLAPPAGTPPAGAMPRVVLEGPRVMLPPALAQGVSMALHELATNATKHGALSREGGVVRIVWSLSPGQDRLSLHWSESGGPPLAGPPARAGFGSRMLEATVNRQLGGKVRRDWRPEGLYCEIELPLCEPRHRDAA